MESVLLPPRGPVPVGLTIRTLGRLTVARDGVEADLPPSRKVRALLAYLALSPHPVGRSRLCELLGDVANDPRGELRWYLSKMRAVLDKPDRPRVKTTGDMIALDLDDCFVDARRIEAASAGGFETLDLDTLQSLCGLFAGDFVEGLELRRSPQLDHWLVVQRRRYRACHTAILERLVTALHESGSDALPHIERWVELAAFDARPQILMLEALVARGQIGAAEEHLASTERMFEAEGLDSAPVRQAWRTLRDTRAEGRRPADASPISATPPAPTAGGTSSMPQRASLAVMPFMEPESATGRGRLGDGLTHDIITRLAKLRSLFVIARGSVFALAERNLGAEEAATRLNVDYVASGTIRRAQDRLIVSVELVERRSARIVWADTFENRPDHTFEVLDRIGNMIVSSIASEIETAEKNRAILKPPSSLNAWEAYHRGLWHMYRFTKDDNEQARHFFRLSSEADPTFARAHAGLSFTHWQSAFQRWEDREAQAGLAYEAAGRSLMIDDHDPAAHWAMGRALWLRRQPEASLAELERTVDISPNFALGHYSLSFVHSQSGDPGAAILSSDHSRHLSPFDPLLFGMMGARAMAHVRLGQFEEGAEWALKAAARPNAHVIILAIAAHCLALAGRLDEARSFAAMVRSQLPAFRSDDFLTTFEFSEDGKALFRKAAALIGLD